MSRNFSTSAKLTISSNLRSISDSGHAEDGAVKIDIFPPGQLTMKTRTNLKQAGHSAANFDTTCWSVR